MTNPEERRRNRLIRDLINECQSDQELGRMALGLMAKIPEIERDLDDLKKKHEMLEVSLKTHNQQINHRLDDISKSVQGISNAIGPMLKIKARFDSLLWVLALSGTFAIIWVVANLKADQLAKLIAP